MLLAPGEYGYDAISVGDHFETGGVTVTEAHVVMFAGLAGDHYDLHTDDSFARARGFEGRVAHGLLGLALLDGLKTRCPVRLDAIASLGWNWSFTGAIYPGDRLTGRFELKAKRETRRPGRGILTFDVALRNDAGDVVQRGEHLLMVRRNHDSADG